MALPVAEAWYTIEKLDPTLYRVTEPHVDPLERAWIYLLKGKERDLLIDGGMGIVPLLPFLGELIDKPLLAVCTHAHIDHVGAMHEVEARLVHPLEADRLAVPTGFNSLFSRDFPPDFIEALAKTGYGRPPELLITALPHEGFDPKSYGLKGAPPTGLIDEGDVIDTGDRRFRVLHLPGHSPGQIGLLEEATGIFFAGDAVYDGPLLYEGPGMSLEGYVATLRRLKGLAVSVVHAGHDPSFDQRRLRQICRRYLEAWGAA
ncbi:MAG: MBL fold metallo-hydrolase [Geminicoccaceae bacterium]|nr:MAG: MBL fold metallo-hydrolase [Geminicoccaceae bacterium]